MPEAIRKGPKAGRGRRLPSFEGILTIARLLSSGMEPETVVESVLMQICKRLGKRARCALLEGEELRLRFWAGEYECPIAGIRIDKGSIVWDAVKQGRAINLTDRKQAVGYRHSLAEPIDIKAVIPLDYVDPITERRKILGALIVDSGTEGQPIKQEDFEYLQVIGELISALASRAELVRQLMTSCRRQEEILRETVHNFRNRIAAIAGFSRSIAKLTGDADLVQRAKYLEKEVKALEAHVREFEKYMAANF